MSQPGMQGRPPAGVAILAALAVIFGIILIFGGLWWLGVGFFWIFTPGTPAGAAFAYGVLWLIMGFIAMVAGGGLLRLQMWAWWLLLIVGIINIISLSITSSWFVVAMWVIVVIYLIAVRKAFTRGPAQPSMT